MPRLTLVPQPSPLSQPHQSGPIDDIREIVAELNAARNGMTDGPAVLWLVNDLMLCCEVLFEDGDTDIAGSGPVAHMRENFMTRLTGFAESIRCSNGALSDEFIAFLASAPDAMGVQTAN
jgi:hypothetical protein